MQAIRTLVSSSVDKAHVSFAQRRLCVRQNKKPPNAPSGAIRGLHSLYFTWPPGHDASTVGSRWPQVILNVLVESTAKDAKR
jgi:hypothetical protein